MLSKFQFLEQISMLFDQSEQFEVDPDFLVLIYSFLGVMFWKREKKIEIKELYFPFLTYYSAL